MTRTVTVYGLRSSRCDEIRYIGQTSQKPGDRLRQHRSDAARRRRTAVQKWIAREEAEGFQIVIVTLIANAVLHAAEIETIAACRLRGDRLLNLTHGGEGTIGWRGNVGRKRPDLAERNRANAGKPGRAISDETKQKISEANTGMKKPHLSVRNRALLGKPGHAHTDESRAKISAAIRGRVVSAETREKISVAARARYARAA